MSRPAAARRPRGTPTLVVLLTVAIVACMGPSNGAPAGEPGDPGASPPAAPVAVSADQVIAALAEAGIAVYDGPADITPATEPAAPVSPYAVLRFQVEQLARDATAGGGVPADELDALIPMPADTPPMSAILAGYVATGQTPGSRFAATLMAGQGFERPGSLWFPTVVLSLFVGEVSGAAEGLGPAAATAHRAPATDAGGFTADIRLVAVDPCGDFSRFFGGVIGSIKDAILSVIPHIPFIGAAIDWALGKVVDAARELLGQVPFLTALREGVMLLALAATVVTSLRDWPVTVTADPGAVHRSVGTQVGHMTMTASIDDGPGDLFSVPVRNCAALLEITLPKGGVVGSTVEWRILDGGVHIAPGGRQDETVDAGKRATFDFDTADESLRDHETGKPDSDPIRVQVTVKRQDVEQVRTLIREMITDAIPATVWDALTAHFGDPVEALTTWTDPKGSGFGIAGFHLPREPLPDPDDPPEEEPGSGSRPPSQEPEEGDFCAAYRDLLHWWFIRTDDVGSQAWAAEIVRRFQEMRPFAPRPLLGAVDVHIGLYTAHATLTGPQLALEAAPWAEQMPEAVAALDAHCDITPADRGA